MVAVQKRSLTCLRRSDFRDSRTADVLRVKRNRIAEDAVLRVAPSHAPALTLIHVVQSCPVLPGDDWLPAFLS